MFDQLNAILLPAHAASTWFMVGLIWFVQVVHYPLMARVGREGAAAYAVSHQKRTTFIVGPAMLVEACSAALLAVAPGAHWLSQVGVVLLGVVWVSTFGVQVPLHARLAAGFDEGIVRRLVLTNWVRTVGWTARGVVALLMMA